MPINEHRLQLLDACLAQAMGSPLSLNDIAEAYARPLMFCDATAEGECDPPVVMQMLAKVYFDLYEHEHLLTYHEEMSNRFVDAIHQALPDIDHDDVVFKFTSMVAVLLHFARNLNPRSFQPQRPGIPPNSGATDASRYDEKALLRLVAFIGAGMAAELTER